MERIVLIIHGVGFFDEKSVCQDVRTQLDSRGISYNSILAFNWDSGTTTFFDRSMQGIDGDLKFLANVGEATLRASHLGFLNASGSYAGIPRGFTRLQNALTLLLQLGCLCSALFACLEFSVLWFPWNWLLRIKCGLLAAGVLTTALGLGARTQSGLTASLRRVLLAFIWPLLYLAARV